MANPLRNLGAGLLRGATADVLGMPVDTLNMLRQAMASPAAGGNPYARRIAGLLGPEMQTGSSDYFAQQMGLPQGQGLLYEGARMVSPSPADLMSMARRVPVQELITYHGTPHRFEPTPANPLGEFEAAKIGTGEGAQAYGHGVYLAEAPDVAKQYAQMDSPFAAAGPKGPAATIVALAKIDGGDNPVKFLRDNYDSQVKKWGQADVDAAIASLERGNLYTADLPDEMIDRMLDWDKPLSEQPEAVQKALMNLPEAHKLKETMTGAQLLESSFLSKGEYKDSQEAARRLKKLGIPGIKYLDQGSRDKGRGTRNFVVFPGEEKKVKILKRE